MNEINNIIYYSEVNLICIIILALFQNRLYHKSEQYSTSRIVFKWLMLAAIFLCAADLVSGVWRGQMFAGARTVIEISNMAYFEAIVVIGYLWMLYVYVKLSETEKISKKAMLLMAIPAAAFTVVVLVNPVTHFLFSIDENNLYTRGAGVYLHWVICWLYLGATTVRTAIAIKKEKSRLRRREMQPLLYFIIAPAVGSVIQMLFYGVTSIQVGVTISIAMVCLEVQRGKVLTDELTGLNNRRGLDNYFENHIQRGQGPELMVLMVDINCFKLVNDKFGHIAGDLALKNTADALKAACRGMAERMFLCRYGGDEFVIAGPDCGAERREKLKNLINEELEKKTKQEKSPYTLSASIGAAAGKCSGFDEAEGLLRRADEEMYEEKKRVGAER